MQMAISFTGGKKVQAAWDDFTVPTDQSPNVGGEGSAPEPFALFLASIGTCAGVYVLGFCQSRGIDAAGVSLELRTVSGPEGKGLARVEIDVVLPPEFPEKYTKAVLRVADQCAVKKAILNPPEFVLAARRAV